MIKKNYKIKMLKVKRFIKSKKVISYQYVMFLGLLFRAVDNQGNKYG